MDHPLGRCPVRGGAVLAASPGWANIAGGTSSRALTPSRTAKLLRAALFTASPGYGCLTLYDALAVRFAGARVPYPRVALMSFMGYAIGHNIGLNTLSGGAVRYRAYTALGLGAAQIATIIAFGTVTFLLGAGLLLGLSLLTQAGMSGSVLHVHASLAHARRRRCCSRPSAPICGWCARGMSRCAGAASSFRCPSRAWPSRRWRWHAPICCARPASCTCCCRIKPRSASAAFAGIYLIAIAAGVDQQCPRRHRRVRGRAAAFDARRAEGPPAGCAGRLPRHLLFCALRRWRSPCWVLTNCGRIAVPAVRLVQLARTFLIAVTPQAIAIAVFLAGAVLLFSGATPGLGNRARPAAQFRAVARPRVVAFARQRGRRGSVGDCARFVSAPQCGLVADDLAAVRRNSAVAAQGFRLRRGHDSRCRGHRVGARLETDFDGARR